jgi:hypothetical protein
VPLGTIGSAVAISVITNATFDEVGYYADVSNTGGTACNHYLWKLVADAPAAPSADAVLELGSFAPMYVDNASGVVTGAVTVAYVEGIPPTNVSITAVSVVDQSNPGAFTGLTALPLTLTNPSPATESLQVQFDNTVAGLTAGQTATGMVEVVWNEVGSLSSSTSSVPVSATYLQVNADNLIAVFDNNFDNADRRLGGLSATISGGAGRDNNRGCNDTTYGTLLGGAPADGRAFKVNTANSGSNLVVYVSVTNNTGYEVTMDSLHFDAIRTFTGTPGAVDVTIYGDVSSNLVLSSSAATNFSINNTAYTDYDDFDVDLTGLADRTLANGENATIQFAFVSYGGGSASYLDNIALLGSGTNGAVLSREVGGWVNLGVSGMDTVVSQVIRMLYTEGDAATNVSINSVTISNVTHSGAFGYSGSLPLTLSTPEEISDVFTLLFDNTVAQLAPGEYAEALVTVGWNEVGAGARTLEFYAYATRPANVPTNGVIALLDTEFLTADAAVDGVKAWMAGGENPGGGSALQYDAVGCLDGTYGSLVSPPATSTNSQWQIVMTNNTASLTISNTTAGTVDLSSIHFDLGRWYVNAADGFTLSLSGDVTAAPALLVANLNVLGFNNYNYDDFDVDLTGLADHILGAGEAAVFTFTLTPDKPEYPFNSAWLDNIAILGEALIPATLDIVNNGDGTVTVSWNTAGTLQSADTVDGPYTDVGGSPVSPAILPSTAAQKFYRVVE